MIYGKAQLRDTKFKKIKKNIVLYLVSCTVISWIRQKIRDYSPFEKEISTKDRIHYKSNVATGRLSA